ncbi:MAG: SH3 domain-containing C40 family peptidase [Gemmatimonadota bacterium]
MERLVAAFQEAHASDPRQEVLELSASAPDGSLRLEGRATDGALVDTLFAELRAALKPATVEDHVVRLPDPALGELTDALVRAGVAPVYAAARLPAAQITQLVLGMRVDLLERRERWLRVRSEDGYVGWVHQGYLRLATAPEAMAWEEAREGEPVVSLGAELLDPEERPLIRLPWGARLLRAGGVYLLPDGASGALGSGEMVDVDRLADRFPPRGESATRTARRWLGAPYLWGGVTPAGVDCSGFVQAVYWMHGVALPRDADLQAALGAPVDPGGDFAELRPGDLLFFAEDEARVTHVTLCLEGALTLHASLTNGCVAIDDLTSSSPAARLLRPRFTGARRLLPD